MKPILHGPELQEIKKSNKSQTAYCNGAGPGNAKKNLTMYSMWPLRTMMLILFIFQLHAGSLKAQNAIVLENQKSGTPASQWDITGAGDLSIQGFATDISVNKGTTVHFKIKTNAAAYTVNIYRIGYYQGNGARLAGTGIISATLPQIQPAELTDQATGLVDCGTWNESAHWDVPSDAVSGIYLAKLNRTDNGGASHIVFIVRDDASTSNLYFQTSDATWQAYNGYGGGSLYVGNTSYPNGHSAKVSYNRPFYTRSGGGGGGVAEDWLFNAEYPMVRWLERNGYDLSYTTNVDADRRGNLIKNHKVFLSVGHDEYWSGPQRTNVEAARDAGVHLAFFSGNEIYWKTRWENSIDGNNTPYRTLVCYKEGTLGENVCNGKCDPMANVWTGLWRDGCNYPQADGCRPENSLSGQISWYEASVPISVPASYKNFRFWRNTNIQQLNAGETATLATSSLGYEIDFEQPNGKYPPGRVVMSQTTVNNLTHKLAMYRASSGALVFGAGTEQWAWGLDEKHDRETSAQDPRMQQATVNLFADMGVQPGSLQSGIVAATATNDLQAPTTVITTPHSGTIVVPNVATTISGTAAETAGIVAGVEVSVDGGVTWFPATGTTSWTYSWTPANQATYSIKSRAVDDMANLEKTTTTSNTLQLTSNQGSCTPPTATLNAAGTNCTGDFVTLKLNTATGQSPYTVIVNNQTYSNVLVGQNFATISSTQSIWGNTGTPANTNDYDGTSIELGVKFRSTQNGIITGIRFYKGTENTGGNVGNLWTAAGVNLASASFAPPTSNGWQEVTFANPVTITANTTYIASYFSSGGKYASTDGFFLNNDISSGALTALKSGVDGENGVYKTGTSGFPNQSYNGSNYWVDLLFKPVSYTYNLTSITDANGCNNTGNINTLTVNQSSLQTGSSTFYQNNDGDGYGNSAVTITACSVPPGYTAQGGDCDDNDATVYPGAPEICGDGKDNNCDGRIDENCAITYYRDADNDGFGNPSVSISSTTPVTGYVTNNGDCNDNNAAIHPGAVEICGNLIDDNCNGVVDESCVVSGDNGPGGPILIITSTSNPFSRYYMEVLRAEGLNEFAVKDISAVTATDLNNYNVVILGEMPVTAANVTMLTNWVTAGGTLVAMRPDAQLAPLLGLTPVTGTLANKYLLVNTATEQGKGIVATTIQFHGIANLYTLNGATALATLYSTATTASVNPAVTLRNIGTNGGQAIAFTYDLARSIVYTHQGNPAWSGQERDGIGPIRSDDLFYGNVSWDPQPDWVDLDKVAIPQADEQQHFLTNMIIKGNYDKKPLPRFWFLPRGLKATIVMTGDDHATGGTAGRFDQYKALSPSNTPDAVKNWTAIRSTSYLNLGSPLTDLAAKGYQADSFEVAHHLNNGCVDFTPESLQDFFSTQRQAFAGQFPSIMPPVTNRTHCLIWSDYITQPKVEFNNGVRLDVNYYYWPGQWVQNRPGMFTGSGMPMRFADLDGTTIDCYQVPTVMTDESDLVFPEFIDSLLNKATGPEGYYGVFCANMHTDNVASIGSDAIINSAMTKNIPIVSSRQMLNWLDSRNGSIFSSIVWNNNSLSFSISAATGAYNLEAMLPTEITNAKLATVTANGSALTLRKEIIKGIEYAFFPATSGNFVATYNSTVCVPPTATLNATPMDCQGQSIALKLTAASGTAPYRVIVNNQTYTNVLIGQNFANGPAVFAEESIWGTGGTPANPNDYDGTSIELGVKFRSSQNGTITGIRFYKAIDNTGTNTINLWSSAGVKLATANFIVTSANGWQEARFATPVAINANTTYVASYFTPGGRYVSTEGFFASTGMTGASVTALQSGVDGSNGVYKEGTSGFPDQTYNSSNYFVDVLFKPNSYTFNLTSITDANGCTNTGNISSATITQSSLQSALQTFYRDLDGDTYGNSASTISACTAPSGYVTRGGDCNDNDASIHPGATEICDGKDNNCDGRVDEGCTIYFRDFDNDTYGDSRVTMVATTPPSGYVANSTDCNDSSASVHPGAVEICGNGIDDNCNGTIDENCTVSSEQSIWGSTGNPANPNDFDGNSIELGVKFRTSQSGSITGIRFYKGLSNTGVHIGSLWNAAGTKLASATFINETASGWQEVHFSTPVSILANTTYIASYFSPTGYYSSTEGFFALSGMTTGSITALQQGVSGPNGLYRYGVSAFPTADYNSSNYWVDVLFATGSGAARTNLVNSIKSALEDKSSDAALSVEVTPNPSASYFTLTTKTESARQIVIKVTNVLGKVMETQLGVKSNGTFRLGSGYPAGYYFVQVTQGNETITVKLIKL